MAQLTRRSTRLPTVGTYLGLARQRWAIITLATLFGLALGGVWDLLQPEVYSAGAAVELPPIGTSVPLNTGDRKPLAATIDTTAQLVLSNPVVQHVREATGQSADEVRAGLRVSAYPLSDVLTITYLASTPAAASTGARAATFATLDQRSKILGGTQLSKARSLYTELRTLRSRAAADVPKFLRLSRRLREQATFLAGLLNQLAPPARFITRPPQNAQLVASHPELYLTTGATSGFVAGVVMAYWRTHLRKPAGSLADPVGLSEQLVN